MGYFSYDNAIKKKIRCSICKKEFITTHPLKKTCSIECSMILKEKTMKQANKDINRYYGKNKNRVK